MKHRLISFFIFATFLMVSCAPQGSPGVPTPIPTSVIPVNPTYVVERGDVISTLELHGRVTAVTQEDLFFGINGVVDEVKIARGDTVKAGQVLATLTDRVSFELAVADAQLDVIKAQEALDTLTEEADLHSAEALVAMLNAQTELDKAKNERAGLDKPRANETTIAVAQTHYELMEANLKNARRLWEDVQNRPVDDPERAEALTNVSNAQRTRDQALATLNWYKGHSTEEQISMADANIGLAEAKYKEAVREYESIKDGPDPSDVALAEATLTRAKLSLDKAQASLDNLQITASFDGQISSVSIAPGTQVTEYKTVLTLIEPEGLEVSTLPTALELVDISVGQTALIRLLNHPGLEIAGEVRYLPLSASNSTGSNADQSVRISIDVSDSTLILGEAAIVTIQLEERKDVLWIPPAALRTFQGRNFVIIQDGDVQRRVDVGLGVKSQERVEILDGLSEGQFVLGP